MELEVQKFLRHQPRDLALTELNDKFAIKATRHGEHPNLVLLKYNQIESPMCEPLVQECRGLILDEADDWRVVAMPYKKFFNAGETLAAPIHWRSAVIWEKLDGSIMTVYHYKDRWYVSTSGVPDASCQVGDLGISFADLFWETWFRQGLVDPQDLNPSLCYMFELCAPHNRVVVQYDEPRLYLHGRRVIGGIDETGHLKELPPVEFFPGAPLPRSFEIGKNLDECLAAARVLNPLEIEGYVVCDAFFNRIKVKSPQYVALHHAKDGLMSKRHVADIVRRGESSEALAYFAELGRLFDDIKGRYDRLVEDTLDTWLKIRDIEDRKAFAEEAKKHRAAGALFAMKDGKVDSPQQYMLGMHEPAYHRLLDI